MSFDRWLILILIFRFRFLQKYRKACLGKEERSKQETEVFSAIYHFGHTTREAGEAHEGEI
jgi:hypothetical protein